jgi:hypothetical protein
MSPKVARGVKNRAFRALIVKDEHFYQMSQEPHLQMFTNSTPTCAMSN